MSEIFSVADTPASRQMLINYVDKYGNIDNSKHNEWQAKLRAKGYPQQTQNVAISNGSECGTDQSVQQLFSMHHVSRGWAVDFIGALIGKLTLDPGQVILSLLPGRSRYHYDFEVSPMLNLNENKNLYNGKIVYKKKILWFIDSQNTLLEGSYNQPANVFPIDKYGGGRYKFPKESMPNFIKNHLTVSDFNFVPTPSAIDLDFGNRTLTDVDYQNSYAYSQYNNRTPFHNFVVERFGASDENRFHTSFSPRNRQFIINQLSNNPTLQNTVLESENLCAKNIEIKGKTPICSDEKNIIFNTGIANYIHWTVTKGANLIDIVGPTNQREIKFNTKPNANGLVEFSLRFGTMEW